METIEWEGQENTIQMIEFGGGNNYCISLDIVGEKQILAKEPVIGHILTKLKLF